MYKVDLPPDPLEQARIDARRNREEQRRSRIFDSKQRTMGLDLDALSQQIEEKKKREAEERAWNEAADAETLRQARIMQLLERREQQDRKAIEKADLEFRATQQFAATRREYDLNDPESLKKTKPLRGTEVEATLGVSSLQIFHGEDLLEAERKQLQAEQKKQWLQEQRDQAKAKKELEEQEKRLYELQELQKIQLVQTLSGSEEKRRIELTRQTAEFNKQLAQSKLEASKAARLKELEQNAEEQKNLYYGALLSEDPRQASAAPGFGVKVLSDRYKGMSEEQRRQYREAQLQQIQEKQQATQANAEEGQQWDKQTLVLGRTLLLREREEERARQALQRQQVAENQTLAQQQKARREYENKVAARNVVGNDFHEQFNKSSR